jgi:hypothetical protein
LVFHITVVMGPSPVAGLVLFLLVGCVRSESSRSAILRSRGSRELVGQHGLPDGIARSHDRLRGGDAPMAAPAGVPLEAPPRAKRGKKKSEATAAAKTPAKPAAAPTQRPNELSIEAGPADQDASTALMHPAKLAVLGIMEGDIVRLKGRRDRETLCIVQESAKVIAPYASSFCRSCAAAAATAYRSAWTMCLVS